MLDFPHSLNGGNLKHFGIGWSLAIGEKKVDVFEDDKGNREQGGEEKGAINLRPEKSHKETPQTKKNVPKREGGGKERSRCQKKSFPKEERASSWVALSTWSRRRVHKKIYTGALSSRFRGHEKKRVAIKQNKKGGKKSADAE